MAYLAIFSPHFREDTEENYKHGHNFAQYHFLLLSILSTSGRSKRKPRTKVDDSADDCLEDRY
jgi:hypothetical protein